MEWRKLELTLIFTLTNGITFEATLVKGDQIKVEYATSDGRKMVYWLKLTNNEKLVLN